MSAENNKPKWQQIIERILTGGEPLQGDPRSGTYEIIPYVITPRNTTILTHTPRFEWNPIPDALTYTVTLRGPHGVILWEDTFNDTSITYAGNPRLLPGVGYSITIEAEVAGEHGDRKTVRSTKEGVAGLAFYLLPEVAERQLNVDLAAVEAMNLAPLEAALERANIYRNYDLMSNAIALLESTSQDVAASADLYRLLGELYLQIGLNTNAQTAFTEAKSLASATGDLTTEADVNVFLAYIALRERSSEETIRLLEEAQMFYQDSGANGRATLVTDLLTTF